MGLFDQATEFAPRLTQMLKSPAQKALLEKARVERENASEAGSLFEDIRDRTSKEARMEAHNSKWNPDAHTKEEWGKQFKELTPLQRWKKQNEALIISGNPILQKQGIDALDSYHKQATSIPTDTRGVQRKYWMDAVNDGTYKGTFPEWMREFGSGTSINNIIDQGKKYLTQAEYKAVRDGETGLPIPNKPANLTREDMVKFGWVFGNMPTEGEASKEASLEQAELMLYELESLIRNIQEEGQGGLGGITGLEGHIQNFRELMTGESALFNSIMNGLGITQSPKSARARALAGQFKAYMLHGLRGVNVGQKEHETMSTIYPTAGQSPEVFMNNILVNMEILANLKAGRARNRGLPLDEKQNKVIIDAAIARGRAAGKTREERMSREEMRREQQLKDEETRNIYNSGQVDFDPNA